MHLAPSLRIALFLLMGSFVAACGGGNSSPTSATQPRGEFAQLDIRVGTGADAVPGRGLSVHYTGWLYDPARTDGKGAQFETSVGRAPYPFTLGIGGVIRGWDQGVPGMKVGGLRRLVIPPELAYGASGSGPVPPNATLVFEIELLGVQ